MHPREKELSDLTGRRREIQLRLLAVGLGLGLGVLAGELLARARVAFVWPEEKKQMMLGDGSQDGRYVHHPQLGYLPRPGYKDHNSLGWRGSEFKVEKAPGTFRIVCIGASTTYGPTGSTAFPAVLEGLLREEGVEAEVINAGVPGWTSRESRLNFEQRVLALDPDLVIIYHGRNDLVPQVYNGYQSDYSHFRDPTHDFREVARANSALKKWFAFSHLFMLVAKELPDISGFREAEEHPIYGAVRVENRPEPPEVLRNVAEPNRTSGFRDNTEAIVRSALESGSQVLLATFAFRPEKLLTGHFLKEDPILYDPLDQQLQRNNEVLRELAHEYGLWLAETEVLADRPEIFRDDCHVTDVGHVMRARILLETLRESGRVPMPSPTETDTRNTTP